MLQSLHKCLFYNETRSFIQNNVLVLTQISLIQIVIVIYDFINGRINSAISDIPVLVIVSLIWYFLKYHKIYYANLVFISLVPLLSWIIYNSIQNYGAVSAVWSFPIVAALFFCFYRYLAWLATAVILSITAFSCIQMLSPNETMRIMVALSMVTFCFVATFSNIYRQYNILEDKANRDPMTKLLNRSLLKDRLLASINIEKSDLQSVVICIDLDNFKYINDTFGHVVGDDVLIQIAKLFQRYLRKTDAVFRMGGEEFLILINNVDVDDAQKIAESIRIQVEQYDFIDNHTVTISMGLAVHKLAEEWGMWLKRADDAMYQAKTTGKNKVVLADGC